MICSLHRFLFQNCQSLSNSSRSLCSFIFKYLIAQTILNITADHIITTEVIVNAGAFSKHTKANIEDHNIP